MWRQRFVTTRRHPLAFAGFAATLALGVLFACGVIERNVAFDGVGHVWRVLWQWEMLLGGLGGIVALTVQPKDAPDWPDLADLLRIEAVAALLCGIGLLTYAVGIVGGAGWGRGSTWVVLAVFGAGMLARGIQASRDSTYVERLAALADRIQHDPSIPTDPAERYDAVLRAMEAQDDRIGDDSPVKNSTDEGQV